MLKIVAFCCNWCSYAGADLAGTGRLQYPADVKIIRVPCSCRVDEQLILRAFKRGADGVLVCGCHIGDCHYSTGNYHTQQRMELLFVLLHYMGLEKERLHLEWISAAEGAKFAQTMVDFVSRVEKLKKTLRTLPAATGLGTPLLGKNQTPLDEAPEWKQNILPAMVEKAKALMASDKVTQILTWQTGAFPGHPMPGFITKATDLATMVYNLNCTANLSKYLIEATRKPGKILTFLRPCDASSFAQLVKENQIKREQVYVIGIHCEGCATNECVTCTKTEHPIYDEILAAEISRNPLPNEAERNAEVQRLEASTEAERHAFWQEQLKKCIRCNACRNICPTCYCKTCVLDNNHPLEVQNFHVTRALHQAGRCTDCGQCSRACPQGIPLYLLNRKLAMDYKPVNLEVQSW